MNCLLKPCNWCSSFCYTLSVMTQQLPDSCKSAQPEDVSWDQDWIGGSPTHMNIPGSAGRSGSSAGSGVVRSNLHESSGDSSHLKKLAHHLLAG